MSADLHIHTTYSDSTLSPTEVLQIASERGIKTIAICDHDTIEGAKEASKLSPNYNIEVIPAVELSTYQNNVEVHILGYYIDIENKKFNEFLQMFRNIRFVRIKKMINKLREVGIEVDYQDVLKISGNCSIGRPHLAQILYETGKVGSLQEAFEKYLGSKSPCYVEKFNLLPVEAITMISQIGGIAVFAHPFLSKFDYLIPEWVKFGLQGIEIYHPQHNETIREHYKTIAQRYNLLITGGSDCHGKHKENILIGTVCIADSFVETLRACSRRYNKSVPGREL